MFPFLSYSFLEINAQIVLKLLFIQKKSERRFERNPLKLSKKLNDQLEKKRNDVHLECNV